MAKMTAGGAIFARLKALGVDYVFANSGTDFPPIIEGLAQAEAEGLDLPLALTIPHEHVAMGMAHGVWALTGRMQAVMLHTNVGLANGAIGALNAAEDQVPMILMSGRTPTTEQGRFGTRTVPIGWGQEMRDQTALVRETTKWDYELRFPEQIGEVLDRAAAISRSYPQRPVYLSLPRAVLCEEIEIDAEAGPAMAPSRLAAPAAEIARAADLLAGAERPIIIGQRGTGTDEGYAALASMAEEWAIPLANYWGVVNICAHDHPTYIGGAHAEALAEADVALVIDSLAPWEPNRQKLRPDLKVIHLGPEPLMDRTPIRNLRADISLATETGPGLEALAAAMTGRDRAKADARRGAVLAQAAAAQRAIAEMGEIAPGQPMTKHFVSAALGKALEERNPVVISELGAPLAGLRLTAPRQWRQEPHAGASASVFPPRLA